jgi:hypothetical protein
MAKRTFVLDDETVRTLRTLAERRQQAQSHIVREAIAVYATQAQRLSDQDRARKLRVLDELLARPGTRAGREVDEELRAIRRARRAGWRRRADE